MSKRSSAGYEVRQAERGVLVVAAEKSLTNRFSVVSPLPVINGSAAQNG